MMLAVNDFLGISQDTWTLIGVVWFVVGMNIHCSTDWPLHDTALWPLTLLRKWWRNDPHD
jgi:hypothetical protein